MPYTPSSPVQIKAELQINGVWTEVTSRTRAAGAFSTRHAHTDGSPQPEGSICEISIGNDDGYLTEGNPRSPWFPYIRRGTPLRISIAGVLASDAPRFTGKIDTMSLVFPASDKCVIDVVAVGQLGFLAQDNDALRSPLYRSTAGIAPGAFIPRAYWSMEDAAGSTSIASGISGGHAVGAGPGVTFASESTLTGSSALPTLATGARLVFPVPRYTDQGRWVVQLVLRVPSEPAAPTAVLDVKTTGSGKVSLFQLTVEPGAPALLRWKGYKADGTDAFVGGIQSLNGSGSTPSEGAFFGSWWLVSLYSQDSVVVPGSTTAGIALANGSSNLGTYTGGGSVGVHSPIAEVSINIDANATGIAVGHLGVFTDAAYPNTGNVFNAKAMTGYTGEQGHIRFARLLTEEGYTPTVLGSKSALMGPQRITGLFDLLTDIEQADEGLLYDTINQLSITYRTAQHLYMQTARLPIANGAITADLNPIFDFQRLSNDWTISRISGSSAQESDEAHVAAIGRRAIQSAQPNLGYDYQLAHHARWHVTQGTAAGPRYPNASINVRNPYGALLADQILAFVPGDRITAAEVALPSQHPPGGLDQIAVGWKERLDVDKWLFEPVLIPNHPYSSIGVWGLLAHSLHAAVSSTATTADIATTDLTQPILATSNLGSGYPVTIGGEDLQVTAVANSAVAYGGVGAVAHANNASVSPGLPASLAQGDLMVMFAAIRNSGAGVPDMPVGWYRFPVFPAASNVQLFGKIAGASESGPTVTFTGGAANADTSAQIIRLTGKWHDVTQVLHSSASSLNTSAQDVTIPGLPKAYDISYYIRMTVAWKQDDWTSATTPVLTQISAPSTSTGDDQAFAWAYGVVSGATGSGLTTSTDVVTGGAPAISRGAVLRLRCDYQTATVTRAINGYVASHSAGDLVTATRPMRWGLI